MLPAPRTSSADANCNVLTFPGPSPLPQRWLGGPRSRGAASQPAEASAGALTGSAPHGGQERPGSAGDAGVNLHPLKIYAQ